MNAVSSNALSLANAAALAGANKGTFTSLLTTKQGTEKGGVVYGDDTVLTVIVGASSRASERTSPRMPAFAAA